MTKTPQVISNRIGLKELDQQLGQFSRTGENNGDDRTSIHVEVQNHALAKLCTQDTFYVTRLKDLGRIYQQTFVDPCRRLAFAKLYGRKGSLEAADLLNSRVIPFFEENGIPLTHVLTDRGREFCGAPPHHRYELYLRLENIAHLTIRSKNPQHNWICGDLHKSLLEQFYNFAFHRKCYSSLEALQAELDEWMSDYNAPAVASLKSAGRASPM